MFPKEHVITSCLGVMALAAYLGVPAGEALAWLAVAAAATVVIDLDHLAILCLKPDGRKAILDVVRNIRHYRSVRRIRDRFHFRGFGVLRLVTHLMEVSALTVAMPLYGIPYSTPILASLWVHIGIDLWQTIADPSTK